MSKESNQNRPKHKKWVFIVLFITTLILTLQILGCGATSRVYVHPQTDLGYVKKVAVLPFDNLTNEKYVGEKISQAFIAEMLIAGNFEIVEPGEVTRGLQSLQSNGSGVAIYSPEGSIRLDINKLNKLTEQLNCQAVIVGAVTSYEMIRVGSEQYPQISINIRMVDGKTGTIIWMSSFTKRGGPGFPFIGFGEKYTLSELSQSVCQDIVQALKNKL